MRAIAKPRVLIVYSTRGGHTETAAHAHSQGAELAGGIPIVSHVDDVALQAVLECDALIIGSPVHMGGADWPIKRFIDDICAPMWKRDSLVGRVVGLFATGGGFGRAGGCADVYFMGMHCAMSQLGCLVMPLPRSALGYANGGSPWGPVVITQDLNGIDLKNSELSLEACRSHAFNVTSIARILGRNAFNTTQ